MIQVIVDKEKEAVINLEKELRQRSMLKLIKKLGMITKPLSKKIDRSLIRIRKPKTKLLNRLKIIKNSLDKLKLLNLKSKIKLKQLLKANNNNRQR